MLLLHPAAMKGLGKLDGSMRPRVVDFMMKFGDHEGNGLRLKPLKEKPYWSARVGDDHRAILAPAGGEAFALLEIRPRKNAYENLDRLRVQMNKVSGDLEYIDFDTLAAIQANPDSSTRVIRSQARRPGLFDPFTHEELIELGIPPLLLPSIDAVTTEDDLLRLVEVLPTLAMDVLLSLAGGESFDKVLERITSPVAAPDPVDTTDFAAALARPGVQVTTVDDAVRAVLDGEFSGWRLWLHPTQATLVNRTFNGPARVSGGPGTGKTVVAVHRAARLARRLPDGEDRPILLTTFNANLRLELAERLSKLLNPFDFKRVHVCTIDSVARAIARDDLDFASAPKPLLTLWDKVREHFAERELDAAFLLAEWQEVICGQLITSRPGYIAARREGRGRRLSRAQRDRIWTMAELFESRLAESGRWTWDQMRASAALLAEQGEGPRYRHVIVDEAQDLTAAQWRMLRAIVPYGPDDVFVVGDSHQRIYGRPVSLGSVGVNVRGRASRLTLSYRTTREILAAAVRVLNGESFDDLDDGADGLDAYRSILTGPKPLLCPVRDASGEVARVVEIVREDAGEVVVCAPANHQVSALLAGLQSAGVQAAEITKDGPPRGVRVHVGTMHRLKGLEYPHVVIAGVGASEFPPPSVVRIEDAVTRDRELLRQRSLLFVATTRARDRLTVVWHGERSPLVV